MTELDNIAEDSQKEEDESDYYLVLGSNSSARKSQVDYNDVFERSTNHFYATNKSEFLDKTDLSDPTKEQEAFKQVLRFSKKQAFQLESKLGKTEVPKFNFLELNSVNHMSKLAKLLESKNLRNRRIKNPEDSDYDEDSDNDDNQEVKSRAGKKKDKKLFQNEALARKYNAINDKITYRRKVINFMYKRSMTNQVKSKTYHDLSVLEHKVSIDKRPKTSGPMLVSSMRKSSAMSPSHEASYIESSRIIPSANEHRRAATSMNNLAVGSFNNKPVPRESIAEKTHFDISRNYSNQPSCGFKVIKNKYNSRIEVFRPPSVVQFTPRVKSSAPGKSITFDPQISTSSLVLNPLEANSPSHGVPRSSDSGKLTSLSSSAGAPANNNNYSSFIEPSSASIPLSLDNLARSSKIMYPKRASTLWKNYS